MTDMVMIALIEGRISLDLHTSDKRAISGFGHPDFYRNFSLILRYSDKDITKEKYLKYGKKYSPLLPMFLVRWKDASN